MPTVAETLQRAAAQLKAANVPDAQRDAALLLAHLLNRSRTFLFTHADFQISEAEAASFEAFIARRTRHEPVQYITGHQAFYELDFEVTRAVLIPRPETELLVDATLAIIKDIPAPFICDIGTGSGCIVLSILHLDKRARAVAVDISVAALQVARRNAARYDLTARVVFSESDCFSNLEDYKNRFDVIVSNPPYIAAGEIQTLDAQVKDYEPLSALTPPVSGKDDNQNANNASLSNNLNNDGLSVIRCLLESAAQYLKSNGFLLFEIGFGQGARVKDLIDRNVWQIVDVLPDLQNIERAFVLRRKN